MNAPIIKMTSFGSYLRNCTTGIRISITQRYASAQNSPQTTTDRVCTCEDCGERTDDFDIGNSFFPLSTRQKTPHRKPAGRLDAPTQVGYPSSFIRTIPSALDFHQINRRTPARGLPQGDHRRWGIAPRPEDSFEFDSSINLACGFVKIYPRIWQPANTKSRTGSPPRCRPLRR